MNNDFVILVNEKDEESGVMEKLEAHQKGLLHRAFSVMIQNSKGEILLQRRALHKYHSGGLWTNTCCSHPRPGETANDAAVRRLKEEMGIECMLKQELSIIYKVAFQNGLIEHELDHIFSGMSDNEPNINSEEVAEWRWITPSQLKHEISLQPENFTYWFKLIMDKYPFPVR